MNIACAMLCLLAAQQEPQAVTVGRGFQQILLLERPFIEDVSLAEPTFDEQGRQRNVVHQFTSDFVDPELPTPTKPRAMGELILDDPGVVRVAVLQGAIVVHGLKTGTSDLSLTYADQHTVRYRVHVIAPRDAFDADTEAQRLTIKVGERVTLPVGEVNKNGPFPFLCVGDQDVAQFFLKTQRHFFVQGERVGLTNLSICKQPEIKNYLIEVVPNPTPPAALPPLPPLPQDPTGRWNRLWPVGLLLMLGFVAIRARRLHAARRDQGWLRAWLRAFLPSLRFSVTTLLLATVGIAVALGVWVDSAHRQERAVKQLRELGAGITYASGFTESNQPQNPDVIGLFPFLPPDEANTPEAQPSRWRELVGDWLGRDFVDPVVKLSLLNRDGDASEAPSPTRYSNQELAVIAEFPDLKSLAVGGDFDPSALQHLAELVQLEELMLFDGPPITERELESLSGLTKLRKLHISNAPVRELAAIAGLDRLECLELEQTEFSDEALYLIGNLPRLKKLSLRGSLSGDALRHLSRLVYLEALVIDSPHVTDAHVKHLLPLRRLKYLTVWGTQISHRGAFQLYEVNADLGNLAVWYSMEE